MAISKVGADVYIDVAGTNATVAAITAAGGQVVPPSYPEAALLADPAGKVLGIWTETAAGAKR